MKIQTSPNDDEDTSDCLSDFESVLDVCCSMGMPRKKFAMALPQPTRTVNRFLKPLLLCEQIGYVSQRL